jgi:hypothetical protein
MDVLANAGHWDPVTRAVVLARVHEVPPLRHFSAEQADQLRPFLDVALDAPPVPVLELVDARLYAGEGDGYRYDDMPEDGETWRRLAMQLREDGFAALPAADRHEYVRRLHDGEHEWEGLNASRAWSVVMRYALTALYSHPSAWNEIGYGGPAYPRGYMRLSGREPHER